ncbi:glycosyltransferase family 2 protein [Phycisphaera mikurensis]|uniref:Putative glycosyltransferase n=1 Tax=Phycisphaera mikurensis (strain NBRC 102666 / KCTC 22515 / FYK2301M01) TaxID=1142394 RepID=I0IBC7_PHYMF|nr:glycosyltransferase [Phycisphaera mikurensis]MBB6443059.1 glycosyltransferase involved in cell wall biosynthesis [Phycisphaera mikurensis]BAM02565.1 putative glycosyltransferase [Phycisphaera mikurensis NBRC 102666]
MNPGAPSSRRYCLISPVRDEAQHMRRTLDSVLGQTEPPTKWVIVDDGSTDETPKILAAYAEKYPCIQVVRRNHRSGRRVGPGVIEAFYEGYRAIRPEDYDYLCKIDLDLDLPTGYFEVLIDQMEANPRLGTCSGKPYFPAPSNEEKTFAGELVSEKCGDEMSVGMIKFYRRECFLEIGGFVSQVMWDGIDCHRARMHGWIACSWDHPALRFIHLRPMGSSQKSIFTGRMRHGFGQWYMGTGLAYMTASTLYRLSRPPIVVGGLAMYWGYLKAMLDSRPRYEDPLFRRFLRSYQWSCLLRGKAGATRRINEAQAPIWIREHGGVRRTASGASPQPGAAGTQPRGFGDGTLYAEGASPA